MNTNRKIYGPEKKIVAVRICLWETYLIPWMYIDCCLIFSFVFIVQKIIVQPPGTQTYPPFQARGELRNIILRYCGTEIALVGDWDWKYGIISSR